MYIYFYACHKQLGIINIMYLLIIAIYYPCMPIYIILLKQLLCKYVILYCFNLYMHTFYEHHRATVIADIHLNGKVVENLAL